MINYGSRNKKIYVQVNANFYMQKVTILTYQFTSPFQFIDRSD